jgi:hypothetical protein
VGELFAELRVVVSEFLDPVMSEFETLSPGCFAGFGSTRRVWGSGPVVAYFLDGFDEVGLGAHSGSNDAGGTSKT